MKIMEKNYLKTDVLIIGGGAAGLFAAIRLSELNPKIKIIIAEKADIRRSGCLAAGVNALNAYIGEGHTPKDYANYAINDAHGIARYDLLLSMSEKLNHVTKIIENLGLVIFKDENGKYITRGWRNVKINGENIKIILAEAVKKLENVKIINHVNISNFLVDAQKVVGAYGFSTQNEIYYNFSAKITLIATGGASGIYLPNHSGGSRHQIWYSPFNTGAGYAMGIKNGAEMTTFEMRFIALRCKDTLAPTGTLAQGVGAEQINSNGEFFQKKYGNTTSERIFAVNAENLAGRGPCYLKTIGISENQEKDLINAYFNMSPSQSLKWLESGENPSKFNVEIGGSEPYIVGGHTASGYWIDNQRRTTLKNLYAAGDAAGGCPQKYVTGAFAEAEIAAESIAEEINNISIVEKFADFEEYDQYFKNESEFSIDDIEIAMQTAMDEYAGGISQNYRFNENQLNLAKNHIKWLEKLSERLHAAEMYDLLKIYELRERLMVAKVLIEHLRARKETRWKGFYQNLDYPERDEKFNLFVNSVMIDGEIKIIYRKMQNDKN
ncbi:MAG: adenylyl-sulfate reductase subunit alpha [Selenomonadaceae bacterium]|nr:adenylyl-sulfate reductase subunit alpha [Selenomonadaceae bacterium]